jgi:flagellar basal body-associated protein FliL
MAFKICGGLLLASILIVVAAMYNSGDFSPDAWKTRDNSAAAYVMMQDFVKDRLKAPASARFPGDDDRGVHIYGSDNQKYLVSGYVDAQNSFGALVRNYYGGELEQTSENRWRLLSLEFSDAPVVRWPTIKTPPPPVPEQNSAQGPEYKPKYAVFTDLEPIQAGTADNHRVVVKVALGYETDNSTHLKTLQNNKRAILAAIKGYFADKDSSYVGDVQNESQVKQDIMDILNANVLKNNIIEMVLFPQYDVDMTRKMGVE